MPSILTGLSSASLALLPAVDVGAVAAHQIVQRQAARREAIRLGVIGAVDQAHRLAHHVAVEPGRAERVLGDHPARREDHEVGIGAARHVARAGQHREDRRVGMVEADRADRVEPRQIVAVRRVIAVPGDDVERRMVERRRPQAAERFLDDFGRLVAVLEPGDRRFEIARVGEAVGADRPKLGQAQRQAMVLRDIAARFAVDLDPELHAARDERDRARARPPAVQARSRCAARPTAE